MKTYILIPLALLSCASVALTENRPYLLVTALFYNDGYGHQVVATSPVSKKVTAVIKHDIKRRITNTSGINIKVTPVARRFKNSRAHGDILGFVRATFKHIYLAELPKLLAAKVVLAIRQRMSLRNIKKVKLNDLDKDTKNNGEVVNTNLISEGNKDDKNMLSIDNIAPVIDTYYMPNTVFYAIEAKCMTPTDPSCYSNKGRKSHSETNESPHHQNTSDLFKKIFKELSLDT